MYNVWTKTEYSDGWQRCDCDDLAEVKTEVLSATKDGREVEVTQPLEFSIEVKVREIPQGEAPKSRAKKAQPDDEAKEGKSGEGDPGGPAENQGSGSEGNGSV